MMNVKISSKHDNMCNDANYDLKSSKNNESTNKNACY